MEYIIVEMENSKDACHNSSDFGDLVNIYIMEGWLPLGGVSIAVRDNNKIFAQAMVKKEMSEK